MDRVLFKFSDKMVNEPILSQIILQLKLPINVITAHIDSKGGEVLAEIPQADLDRVVKAFRDRGVTVCVPKLLEVDKERCISCGSCVTLCPVEAITFDQDKAVVFDKEKCVGSTCSACVDACPVRAIKSSNHNSENNNSQ
jgi:formate hydrogenlyase subunit 6/NADH:ubiquinone oxidoreductase subunit I